MLIISGVSDPGIVTKFSPSPASIPARVSPVAHSIFLLPYRKITNDSTPLVASTHWNVLTYRVYVQLVKIHNYT